MPRGVCANVHTHVDAHVCRSLDRGFSCMKVLVLPGTSALAVRALNMYV